MIESNFGVHWADWIELLFYGHRCGAPSKTCLQDESAGHTTTHNGSTEEFEAEIRISSQEIQGSRRRWSGLVLFF